MTHPADQYMIYHLVSYDEVKQKWNKKPVGLDGAPLMAGGGIPTHPDRAAVEARIVALNAGATPSGPRYVLGLWIDAVSRLFFLDLDEDAVSGGALTPSATDFAHELVAAGCYFEASSSGRGAHVIGRYSGELPPHTIQRPLNEPAPHALYVAGRGCVLSDVHAGSWDVDATAPLLRLLAKYFAPRAAAEDLHAVTAGPRPEYRGPYDDAVLVRRMLSAAGSAAARLRGSVPLSKLWAGECEHNNESDYALAAHLAFWTGCEPARMERLMRQSPMYGHRADKWDTHATYLRELTINNACATTSTVYVEPQRVDTAAVLLGTARPVVAPLTPPGAPSALVLGDAAPVDWHTLVDSTIATINNSGTCKELMDTIMPTLGTYGWPGIHGERVLQALSKRLELFNAKQPIATLRRLVMPPMIADALLTQTVPEWAQPLVYVLKTDKFYDTGTGSDYTATGLRMNFQRNMPMKQSGVREDPVQWLMDRWNVTNVDDLEYRPDQPAVFEFGGRSFANLFRASTMPTPVVGSPECAACIALFLQHLYAVVNRRDHLYHALLGWMAHNVQHPGAKIFWSPLIKGVQGDGKSIFGELLRNVMGRANVKVTSSSSISNKGGFTDWAAGKAVNVIEEIKLEGKESRAMYNNMKTLVGDSEIDLNRKGKASGDNLFNVTNHWANTQHVDAVPVEKGERRWLIVFTPWQSAAEAAAIKGVGDADALPAYFERLGASMRSEPGAWRNWLLGVDLSTFNPKGRALWTPERESMMSGSEDFIEQTVRDCLERGGTGITLDVFSSSHLFQRVQTDLGEKPDTRTWNRTLTHLGYQQITRLEWMSKTRRIWSKRELSNAEVVEILNKSCFPA